MAQLTTGMHVQRTYLFVPPEEKSEVQALGARWDADAKAWYIDSQAPAAFARWLPASQDDEEFTIISTEAFVAAATTACQHCHAPIEVICIHCASGTVCGDPLDRFTVSDISAMGEELARQLERWPTFRAVDAADGERYFANHCARCGAPQDDMRLHSEPDEPFFDVGRGASAALKLTPLVGTVHLSGDEHFEVQ